MTTAQGFTPDPATFTGLLEVCHANGLPTHGWKYFSEPTLIYHEIGDFYMEIGPGWHAFTRDENRKKFIAHRTPESATPTDLAAVCFEVARWLRDKRDGMSVARRYEKGVVVGWCVYWNWPGMKDSAEPLDCADNEPAALLAACKEVGK